MDPSDEDSLPGRDESKAGRESLDHDQQNEESDSDSEESVVYFQDEVRASDFGTLESDETEGDNSPGVTTAEGNTLPSQEIDTGRFRNQNGTTLDNLNAITDTGIANGDRGSSIPDADTTDTGGSQSHLLDSSNHLSEVELTERGLSESLLANSSNATSETVTVEDADDSSEDSSSVVDMEEYHKQHHSSHIATNNLNGRSEMENMDDNSSDGSSEVVNMEEHYSQESRHPDDVSARSSYDSSETLEGPNSNDEESSIFARLRQIVTGSFVESESDEGSDAEELASLVSTENTELTQEEHERERDSILLEKEAMLEDLELNQAFELSGEIADSEGIEKSSSPQNDVEVTIEIDGDTNGETLLVPSGTDPETGLGENEDEETLGKIEGSQASALANVESLETSSQGENDEESRSNRQGRGSWWSRLNPLSTSARNKASMSSSKEEADVETEIDVNLELGSDDSEDSNSEADENDTSFETEENQVARSSENKYATDETEDSVSPSVNPWESRGSWWSRLNPLRTSARTNVGLRSSQKEADVETEIDVIVRGTSLDFGAETDNESDENDSNGTGVVNGLDSSTRDNRMEGGSRNPIPGRQSFWERIIPLRTSFQSKLALASARGEADVETEADIEQGSLIPAGGDRADVALDGNTVSDQELGNNEGRSREEMEEGNSRRNAMQIFKRKKKKNKPGTASGRFAGTANRPLPALPRPANGMSAPTPSALGSSAQPRSAENISQNIAEGVEGSRSPLEEAIGRYSFSAPRGYSFSSFIDTKSSRSYTAPAADSEQQRDRTASMSVLSRMFGRESSAFSDMDNGESATRERSLGTFRRERESDLNVASIPGHGRRLISISSGHFPAVREESDMSLGDQNPIDNIMRRFDSLRSEHERRLEAVSQRARGFSRASRAIRRERRESMALVRESLRLSRNSIGDVKIPKPTAYQRVEQSIDNCLDAVDAGIGKIPFDIRVIMGIFLIAVFLGYIAWYVQDSRPDVEALEGQPGNGTIIDS